MSKEPIKLGEMYHHSADIIIVLVCFSRRSTIEKQVNDVKDIFTRFTKDRQLTRRKYFVTTLLFSSGCLVTFAVYRILLRQYCVSVSMDLFFIHVYRPVSDVLTV